MAINDILSRLAQKVGLKAADARNPAVMVQKLEAAQKLNVDKIELIKDEIRTLETRALKKKKEMDAARGESKRVVAGEIERTFKDLDRLKGRERILSTNLDQISLALSKLSELQAARETGVDEGVLDDIAIETEDAFDNLKARDKAATGLDKLSYEAPVSDAMDLDARFKDMEADAPETERPKSNLSADAQRRLKELESEE